MQLTFLQLVALFIRDPGGIQTPNPQSRNLMRYSVAPLGHLFYFRKSENLLLFFIIVITTISPLQS